MTSAASPRSGSRRFRGRTDAAGLRTRIFVLVSATALVLSGVLSATVYLVSRSYLLSQREESAIRQTVERARRVAAQLPSPRPKEELVLVNAPGVLIVGPNQYGSSIGLSERLPVEFRNRLRDGQATRQRLRIAGVPSVVVGVPILSTEEPTAYVESTSLAELESTLRTLATILFLASGLTTLAAALASLSLSQQVVRPLRRLAETAERVEAGDLSARLSITKDRDLGPLLRSFNGMVDSMQARLEREARFTSNISHELRSPLTTVRTAVELVGEGRESLPPRAQAGFELLSRQIDRFERLVLDLLELARIDGGATSAPARAINAVGFARRTVEGVGSDAVVIVSPAAEGVRVAGDPRRLEGILRNLLDNARIHGGGAVAVTIERDGRMVRFSVDDAGPGVPFGERDGIFERFARGAKARHGAGAGLGLAIVDEHARAMGGSVSVTDRPNGERGARFVIELPVAPDAE